MNTINKTEVKLHIMKQIQYFCDYATANEKCAAPHKYEMCGGDKFIRVAQININRDGSLGGKSVHFFVNTITGDVFKSAGWAAPSKTTKYNIMDAEGLAELIRNWSYQNQGYNTGYLYASWKKVPATY